MRRIIFLVSLVLVLGVTFYMYWFYYNVYSDGTRVGRVTKFSRKGNVFKTYEGELKIDCEQTFNRQTFYFSVTDENVAAMLEHAESKCVELHYVQYRRDLSWRGEDNAGKNGDLGQYIVDKVSETGLPAGPLPKQ